MSLKYDDAQFAVKQQQVLPGNDLTTLLLTPQAGTGAETKTHTTTLKPWAPQRAITLKKLAYQVETAQTGTGCNLALDVYVGTTSVASLAVTATAALGIAESSANIDEDVDSDEYVRIYAKSTTTASTANAATGLLSITYQETFLGA